MRPKHKRASLKQDIQISDLLRQHTRVVGNDGKTDIVEYAEGWSDRRIAEIVDLSTDTISNKRRELMGNLHSRKEAEGDNIDADYVMGRIDQHNDAIVNLQVWQKQVEFELPRLGKLEARADAAREGILDVDKRVSTALAHIQDLAKKLEDLKSAFEGRFPF